MKVLVIETSVFFSSPWLGGGGGRTAGRRGAKDNTEREGCIRREIKEREMVVLIKEGKGGSLGDIAYSYLFFCNRTKGLIKG